MTDANEEIVELREANSNYRMLLVDVYNFLRRIAPNSDIYHRVRKALGYLE